jgi:hypothetical protein
LGAIDPTQGMGENETTLLFVLIESDELIRIFISSVKTAQKNALILKRKSATSVRYSSSNAG